jgi:hypothetical protein
MTEPAIPGALSAVDRLVVSLVAGLLDERPDMPKLASRGQSGLVRLHSATDVEGCRLLQVLPKFLFHLVRHGVAPDDAPKA